MIIYSLVLYNGDRFNVSSVSDCTPPIEMNVDKLYQRTNGPVNAHLGPEIYTCTNKLVRLEWYNACI